MKTKLIALVLILTLGILLVSCDDTTPSEPVNTTNQVTDSEGNDTPTDEPETPAPDTDEPETPAPDTDKPADETDKPVDPADKDRLKADLVAALRELLTGCTVDPASVIPETMLVDYRQNLVDPSKLSIDYGSNVSVSDIPAVGSGEQWHMVLENLYSRGF